MEQYKKLLIVLLSVFCLGADNPSLVSYPEGKIMGFRGLDTKSTAPTIADSRAEDLLNVKLSTGLDLRKRYGYSLINDTLDDWDINSPAITGIFDAVYSNGNSWTLVFTGSKLKYDNSGTWTSLSVVGETDITSGQNYQWQCILALDNAICTNDTNPLLKINSTPVKAALDVSDLSDALTKVKAMAWFRNYLIFGNTVEAGTELPTRFRWSDVGTIETYQDDNFIDISTFGGDEIIGFAELYGDLYIFLTKSIWKASFVGGDDIFVIQKVIDGIGSVARDSIQTVQLLDNRSAIIFLDERKKVLMFNGVSITDIGNRIQPTLDGLNEARLKYAVSTFDGESYYLSVSTSAITTNDNFFEYNVEMGEWTKHSNINANALAQVKESDETIKTYFGNYQSFVYWLDNPDNNNDVKGGTGVVDSVQTATGDSITSGQAIIDSSLVAGDWTGALLKITSGTAVGESQYIIDVLSQHTGVITATAFSTTPDSTSVYSIGAIDAYYTGKWYDLGDSAREKNFLGLLFWAEEASSSEVTISYAIDFGSTLGSETKSLSPSGSSLWDTALWDVGTWGTTGDKLYTAKHSGFGNFIQPKFENSEVDETFHIYGFNLLATVGDIKQ